MSRQKGDAGKVRLPSQTQAQTTMPLTGIAQRLNTARGLEAPGAENRGQKPEYSRERARAFAKRETWGFTLKATEGVTSGWPVWRHKLLCFPRFRKVIQNSSCGNSRFVMESRMLGKKPCKPKQTQIRGFGCCPTQNW